MASNKNIIASDVKLNGNTLTGSGGGSSVGGSTAFAYTFSTDTTATDPTSGAVKLNNATPSSATEIYISDTDGNSFDIGWVLDVITSARVSIEVDASNYSVYEITSAGTDNTGWRTITVTHVESVGSLAAGTVTVKFVVVDTNDGGGGSSTTIGVKAKNTVGGSLTANVTDIIYDTIDSQTGGTNYNNANGQFTVPEEGWYFITASGRFSAANSCNLGVYVNGSVVTQGDNRSAALNYNVETTVALYLQVNDVVTIRSNVNLTLTAGFGEYIWLSIIKFGGAAAAATSVAKLFSAKTAATTSLTAGVTPIPYDGGTIRNDDWSSPMSAGVFTVPEDGIYTIFATAAITTGTARSLAIYVDGTLYKYGGSISTSGYIENVFAAIKLTASQTVSIRSSSGGTLSGLDTHTQVEITKL